MSLRLLRGAVRRAVLCRRQDNDVNIVITDLPKKEVEPEAKQFKKGDQPQYAYNDQYAYPEDYKPWSFNYKGDGMLLGALAGMWFAYFEYEKTYLNKTGRTHRPENKTYYKI